VAEACGFYAAIETAGDSLVTGGPAARRDAMLQAVNDAGGRATLLPVEVASHTPLMDAAPAPFATLLGAEGLRDPDPPVLSGISAQPVGTAAQAVEHLSRQLAETIRWKSCMDALAEAGITVALELGPGAALARMLQGSHPQIACRSVADFRSPAGVRAWLAKHIE